MKFLLIDIFAETKLGREQFHEFYGIMDSIITNENNIDCGQYEIITRRYDNLNDYIIDWEYTSLLSNSKSCAKAFDLIDMICIGGDLKILPWDSKCYQLITFIHMCNLMSKPLLTIGSGAHFAIYTCATQGQRFQLLNPPFGDSIENIKTQETYFKGPKGYPCGWLDNETGDIFSYDSSTHRWVPVVNVGIYRLSYFIFSSNHINRIAQTGTPTPSRYRPVKKKFGVYDNLFFPFILSLHREGRLLAHQVPNTPDDHDGLIIIRQPQQNYFGFKTFKSFVISGKILDDWYFNVDGALPLQTGLEILADGPYGPIIFKYQQHSLHIACSLTNHHISVHMKELIRNYYHHLFNLIRANNTLGRSCYNYIYQEHHGDINESAKLSLPLSPPLSNLPIRSRLKGGPKLIYSPVTEIHETPHIPVFEPDVSHIIGPPKSGKTRVFKQQYRDPYRMKHLRLQQIFETCYGENKAKELGHISDIMRRKLIEEHGHDPDVELATQLIKSAESRSPSPSRPASPSSPSRPASPSLQASAPQHIPPAPERALTATAIKYESHSRASTAADAYRRCHTTSESRRGPPLTHPTRSMNPSSRINWKSEWKTVRGGDENMNQEERNEMSLEEEIKLAYLPLTHPLSRPSTIGSMSSVYKSTNPVPEPPVVTTRLRPQTARPYSSYKNYEKKIIEIDKEETHGQYKGVFRGGYLTPYERERKEYQGAKEKFLDGTFKTYSGKASEIPLRSHGGVQHHGPYPAPIQSDKEVTKVGHYGPWKPTTDLYPSHKGKSYQTVTRSNSRHN